jgi:hypothetical protein
MIFAQRAQLGLKVHKKWIIIAPILNAHEEEKIFSTGLRKFISAFLRKLNSKLMNFSR